MIDPLRLRALLERLGEEVTDLRRLAGYDTETLLADRDKLKSAKYGFVVAIEACIDAGQHVIASEGYRAPAKLRRRVLGPGRARTSAPGGRADPHRHDRFPQPPRPRLCHDRRPSRHRHSAPPPRRLRPLPVGAGRRHQLTTGASYPIRAGREATGTSSAARPAPVRVQRQSVVPLSRGRPLSAAKVVSGVTGRLRQVPPQTPGRPRPHRAGIPTPPGRSTGDAGEPGPTSADFAENILPVIVSVAAAWGRLDALRPLPTSDGLIAATALVHDLTLVTRNTRDFDGTGARLLDPFST